MIYSNNHTGQSLVKRHSISLLEHGFASPKIMFWLFAFLLISGFSLKTIAANQNGMEHGVIKAPGGLPIIWSKDIEPPIITLKGRNPHYIEERSIQSYSDAGATATDNVDGNVTVTRSGTVNVSVPGTYPIKYTATDSQGNIAEVTRNVIITKRNTVPPPQVAGPGTIFAREAKSWGMDRIDQRFWPLDGVTKFQNAGAGVRIYIIGSGVEKTLPDLGWENSFAFGPQIISSRFLPGWSPDYLKVGYSPIDDPYRDCVNNGQGHESIIAQIIGGNRIGLVPNAKMVSVRTTAGCRDVTGTGDLLRGLQFILDDAIPGQPTIVNFSRKVSEKTWLDAAVLLKRIADRGIVIVAAAGNDNGVNLMEGCERVASTIPSAIIVGASQKFSLIPNPFFQEIANRIDIIQNGRGPCVDLYAPGNFLPYFPANGTPLVPAFSNPFLRAEKPISGSSYAAPHVTAAVAMLLSANPNMSPAQVKRAIIQNSTKGVLSNMVDSADSRGRQAPNRLLYIGTEPHLSVSNPPFVPQFSYGDRNFVKSFQPINLSTGGLSRSLTYLGPDYLFVDNDSLFTQTSTINTISAARGSNSTGSPSAVYAQEARFSFLIPGIDFRKRWGTQKAITKIFVKNGGMKVFFKKGQFNPSRTIFDGQGLSRPAREYRSASRLGPANEDYLLNEVSPAYNPLSKGPRVRMFYEDPRSSNSSATRELFPESFWNYLLTTETFARDIQMKVKYIYSGRVDPNWQHAFKSPNLLKQQGIEIERKIWRDVGSGSNPRAFLSPAEKQDPNKHNIGSKMHLPGERHIERSFVVPQGVKTMIVRSLPAKLKVSPKPGKSLNGCSYKDEVPTTLFVGYKRKLNGVLGNKFTGKPFQPVWECVSVGSDRQNGKKVNDSAQECTFHGGVAPGEWVVASLEPNDHDPRSCFRNAERMIQTIQVFMYNE